MKPTFRQAERADIELLLGFVREYYAFDGHSYERESVRAALDRLLGDPSLGQIWLICDGQEPIGYVVLALGYSIEYRGRDAFVDELYLRESYRGRGIGTQTFAFLEAAGRALGVRALHLEVEHHNTGAQRFYRAIGFYDQERYLMTKLL
jgi:ribosomal protein S18 acetylase RimI-like enzyme